MHVGHIRSSTDLRLSSLHRYYGRAQRRDTSDSTFFRCTEALTSLRYRLAQRHIPRSGAMIVLPGWVKEYSTAIGLEVVTCLAIKPEDSRLRKVLVSIRCETPPRWRRNSPCRYDFSLSENKIFGAHLPIKIGAMTFDFSIVSIVSRTAQKGAIRNIGVPGDLIRIRLPSSAITAAGCEKIRGTSQGGVVPLTERGPTPVALQL